MDPTNNKRRYDTLRFALNYLKLLSHVTFNFTFQLRLGIKVFRIRHVIYICTKQNWPDSINKKPVIWKVYTGFSENIVYK